MTCLIVHLPFPTSKSKTIVQFQTVDVPGVIHDVPLKSIKDICLGPRHELLVVNCCFVLSRPVLVCFFSSPRPRKDHTDQAHACRFSRSPKK